MPLGSGLKTERNAAGQEIVDCGEVFPGHELAIVDEAGNKLGEQQVGQIVARGPSVSHGYFQEPELTAETYKPLAGDDGGAWLHTGDLGYLANGRLFVCGRVKDIIIIRGRNYYPNDIEWAVGEGLRERSGVRRENVVAFGVDVNGEEQLVLCCEGTSVEAPAIKDAATKCVAEQFGLSVHEVVVAALASMPRTSSGKPQRRKTRQMFLDGTLPRARSVQGASLEELPDTSTQGGA
jgi:fatty-acyl-CoA synthase